VQKRGWPPGSDRPGFGRGGPFGGRRGGFDHHGGPPRDLGTDRPPRPYFGGGRGPLPFPPAGRRDPGAQQQQFLQEPVLAGGHRVGCLLAGVVYVVGACREALQVYVWVQQQCAWKQLL
jgi:hypothetical protein